MPLHVSHGVMINIAFGVVVLIGIVAFLALPTKALMSICHNTPDSIRGLAEVPFDGKAASR